MKNRLPMLASLVIVFIGLACYGGLSANEPVLGLGIGAAFLCLAAIPAFYLRAQRLRKIVEKENALIRFEYEPGEIEEIAAAQRYAVIKKSKGLSLLFSICFAIIFTPFVLFSMEPESKLPLMLPIALSCVLLPWLSLIVAPYTVSKKIRTRPCISLVGRDYVFVTNRYHGVNDRYALEADFIEFEKGIDGAMSRLRVCYRFKAMRTSRIFKLWVDIPVPHTREDDAMALKV